MTRAAQARYTTREDRGHCLRCRLEPYLQGAHPEHLLQAAGMVIDCDLLSVTSKPKQSSISPASPSRSTYADVHRRGD
jgi:hypothetical protein